MVLWSNGQFVKWYNGQCRFDACAMQYDHISDDCSVTTCAAARAKISDDRVTARVTDAL